MITIAKLILLSILPISELRGAIIYSKIIGMDPLLTFFIATLANIAIVPFIFFFLDYLHHFFLRARFYKRIFYFQVRRTTKKIEKHIGTKWELPALYLLVAIPLPFTGAYTGVLAAWIFKIRRKKALLAIVLGVLTAGILLSSGLSLI